MFARVRLPLDIPLNLVYFLDMAHTTTTNREAAMFTVSVITNDLEDAISRVAGRLPNGFAVTGRAAAHPVHRSLSNVEVDNLGGDVDDCWVVLTSYGMSPAKGLGACWQQVKAVGC